MTRWTMTCLCLPIVVVTMVTLSDGKPNLHFAEEHIKRTIQSEDIDGYDTATVYAVDTTTNEETRQIKHDIETHASDPSSDKRRFSLEFASGEQLRMSLDRRSIVTSGTKVTEITEEGEMEITLPRRDCFFSGRLEGGAEGFASLAMCDGDLMGSITTSKRDYDIQTLRNTRDADDVTRVLVTWRDKDRERRDQCGELKDEVEIPDDDEVEIPDDDEVEIPDDDEVEIPDDEAVISASKTQMGRQIRNLDSTEDKTGHSPLVKRSMDDRKATIEIGNFVDKHFLAIADEKMGLNTTQQIIDLLINKWSGVANILSDGETLGWNLTLRLAKVTIMRTDPLYYNTTVPESLGTRLKKICIGTKPMEFDQVTLHTGHISNLRTNGLGYLRGICNSRYRCAANINAQTDFMAELHELGHNLGLDHDKRNEYCLNSTDPSDITNGFMQGNRDHVRKCYKPVLDNLFLSGKRNCIFEDYFSA